MGIQELIEKVGQQNVDVQWIHQSSPNIQAGKRGGTIQFATCPETARTMATGETFGDRKILAAVVFFKAEDLKNAEVI